MSRSQRQEQQEEAQQGQQQEEQQRRRRRQQGQAPPSPQQAAPSLPPPPPGLVFGDGDRVLDKGVWKRWKRCLHCQQVMVERAKWRDCWEAVRFCSDRCRAEAKRAQRVAGGGGGGSGGGGEQQQQQQQQPQRPV